MSQINEATVSLTVNDMLAIIERQGREIAAYASNPTMPPENLLRHLARTYAFAEKLNEMWLAQQKKDGADATESNGAEQVN